MGKGFHPSTSPELGSEWARANQKLVNFFKEVGPEVQKTFEQWIEIDPDNLMRVVDLASEIHSPKDLEAKVFQWRRDIQRQGGELRPWRI